MTLAIAVGFLAAVGTWLVVRGGAVRLILGFILLGHAANLIIISAGGAFRREAPLVDGQLLAENAADPLPQAFVLTAIVITFGVTVYLLSLVARTAKQSTKVEDETIGRVESEIDPATDPASDPASDEQGGSS